MRTNAEKLTDALDTIASEKFILENMNMSKAVWLAAQEYMLKQHGILLGQPPLNVIHGVAYKDTVGFVSMRGK